MVKKKEGRQYREDGPVYKQGSAGNDESFEQLLAESESFQTVKSFEIGDEVEASVLGFDNEFVFLDLGTRLDGMLRKQELMRDGRLTVSEGDTINVFITGRGQGAWKCSCKAGAVGASDQDPRKIAALMRLEEAYQANNPVEGKVTEHIKGGFEVQLMGVKAFCPISQVDIAYSETPENHVGKTYTFYITQFEEEGNNLVVSRKEYLRHEANKKAEKLWQQVEEGAVYEGRVKSLQDFGAFVDIGGIEGLLHISEISYERIGKPADVLKMGQTLDVAVIDVDRQRRKLSLSTKALLDDPWIAAIKKLKPGGEYQGKVIRMKTYGAFIQLYPGVDGMVHISRLGTDRIHKHPKEILKIGDIITVRVMEIDEKNRKISLTLEKQEGDYSKDLAQLKKEQDKSTRTQPGHMANLVDDALEKKET
jgi:small subunit ribosomal protein S1